MTALERLRNSDAWDERCAFTCAQCGKVRIVKYPSKRRTYCSKACSGARQSLMAAGPVCKFPGCTRKVSGGGTCQPHRNTDYWRPKALPPMLERFEERVLRIPFHSCWEWDGARMPNGYGKWTFSKETGKSRLAHRIAYELFVGPIPAGLQIDHLCRNRGCVNPAHLEAVPGVVNNRRGNSLSAQRRRQTHCKRGHLFDHKNTYLKPGTDYRICRRCMALWQMSRRKGVSVDELAGLAKK